MLIGQRAVCMFIWLARKLHKFPSSHCDARTKRSLRESFSCSSSVERAQAESVVCSISALWHWGVCILLAQKRGTQVQSVIYHTCVILDILICWWMSY